MLLQCNGRVKQNLGHDLILTASDRNRLATNHRYRRALRQNSDFVVDLKQCGYLKGGVIMANGWASEGAVQEQIDSTVNDGIERVRQSIGHGESATECELCGEPIPEARRQALKGVRYCVVCQAKIDKQQQNSSLYNRRGSKDSQLR